MYMYAYNIMMPASDLLRQPVHVFDKPLLTSSTNLFTHSQPHPVRH